MRGGKRKNAGRKPGSSGIKKTKLKATEALKVTKGIRFMPEQIQRIEEAVRLSDAKNFSQFVVNASIKKADATFEASAGAGAAAGHAGHLERSPRAREVRRCRITAIREVIL